MKYNNLIQVFEGEDLVNLADFLNLKYEKMLNGKEYYMLIIRSKFRMNVRRINTRILSDKIYSFLKNETDVIEHSGKRYRVAENAIEWRKRTSRLTGIMFILYIRKATACRVRCIER